MSYRLYFSTKKLHINDKKSIIYLQKKPKYSWLLDKKLFYMNHKTNEFRH